MSWQQTQLLPQPPQHQQQQQQQQQHYSQQQGHIVLLLAGSVFAPFTLLGCLALYKLTEWRQADKPQSDSQAARRRSWLRQALLLAWLAAAAAFASAGANVALVMRDLVWEAMPGDQRLMRLGGWSGLCGVVELTADSPTEAKVIAPGLAMARWPAETFRRQREGRMVGKELRAAWEMPAGGGGRTGNLTVTANFRHRVELSLMRRLADEADGRGGQEEVQLADSVHGINFASAYNLTLPGRLTLRLTNLDLPLARGAEFNFSYSLTAWRFASQESHFAHCRLGQEPCRLDNPPPWLVLQALPADPAEQPHAASPHRRLSLRCQQPAPAAKAAPALAAALVCLPCALVLAANAWLAGDCRGVAGRAGRRRQVRFQLEPERVEKY